VFQFITDFSEQTLKWQEFSTVAAAAHQPCPWSAYACPDYGQLYEGFGVATWQSPDLQVWHPVICQPLPPKAQQALVSSHETSTPATPTPEKPVYKDAETPYGVGGPWLVKSLTGKAVGTPSALSQFWQAWHAYCQTQHIMAELIRFDPLTQSHQAFIALSTPKIAMHEVKSVFTLPLGPPEVLLAELTPHLRRDYHRAERLGVNIAENSSDYQAAWQVLYQDTMQQKHAAPQWQGSPAFFKRLFTLLAQGQKVQKGQGVLLHATQGKHYLGGALFLFNPSAGSTTAYYHLSALTPEGKRLGAGVKLIVAGALHLYAQGATQLFLGGGVQKGDSLEGFKRRFSPNTVYPYTIGTCLHLPQAHKKVCKHVGVTPTHVFAYR
jgi:hypothetical protein